MYLQETINGKDSINVHFIIGMFVKKEYLAEADKVEVWCSNFKDSGGDFNEFRLFKKDAPTPFHVQRKAGY